MLQKPLMSCWRNIIARRTSLKYPEKHIIFPRLKQGS